MMTRAMSMVMTSVMITPVAWLWIPYNQALAATENVLFNLQKSHDYTEVK